MELCAQHKGMVFELGDLHQSLIRGEAREDHAGFTQLLPVGIAELKTMAVAFLDHLFPVGFGSQRSLAADGRDTGPDAWCRPYRLYPAGPASGLSPGGV